MSVRVATDVLPAEARLSVLALESSDAIGTHIIWVEEFNIYSIEDKIVLKVIINISDPCSEAKLYIPKTFRAYYENS